MSNERTDLLSVVRDIIKDRDEIEKALPLDESKFGRWPGKKRKRTQPLDITQEDIQEMTREDE
jgi:hypothetical protein